MNGTKWEFNESVTAQFEQMLKRSIPQYDVMRKCVYDIFCLYAKDDWKVLDIGSSRGDSVMPLIKKFPNIKYYLTEISKPMIKVLENRFYEYNTVLCEYDLRHEYPHSKYNYVQSILTLQFIPLEYRQKLVQNIYNSLEKDGIFVLVEKVLGDSSDINDVMVKNYYKLKSENSYKEYEIERKKQQLEGILVPVTAKWNESLLHVTGFKQYDCFWRWMNFAGWLAIK